MLVLSPNDRLFLVVWCFLLLLSLWGLVQVDVATGSDRKTCKNCARKLSNNEEGPTDGTD